jgi:hypothetical protein
MRKFSASIGTSRRAWTRFITGRCFSERISGEVSPTLPATPGRARPSRPLDTDPSRRSPVLGSLQRSRAAGRAIGVSVLVSPALPFDKMAAEANPIVDRPIGLQFAAERRLITAATRSPQVDCNPRALPILVAVVGPAAWSKSVACLKVPASNHLQQRTVFIFCRWRKTAARYS